VYTGDGHEWIRKKFGLILSICVLFHGIIPRKDAWGTKDSWSKLTFHLQYIFSEWSRIAHESLSCSFIEVKLELHRIGWIIRAFMSLFTTFCMYIVIDRSLYSVSSNFSRTPYCSPESYLSIEFMIRILGIQGRNTSNMSIRLSRFHIYFCTDFGS